MKKCFIIILFVAFNIYSFSQIKIPRANQSEITKFLNSKTYIILKNDKFSDYNEQMIQAIKNHWTITEYEFVYESDFNNLKSNPKNSFLMINQVYFEKDKTKTLFDFLILTISGNYKTVNDMPTLCAIPLCYKGALEEEYSYKIGLMLKFAQMHVNSCNENPNLSEDKLANYYMAKTTVPKNKTFYLLKEEVEPEIRTKNAFASAYPFNFEYSNREDIQKLIDNNDEDAIILHIIGPQTSNTLTYCIKIIIDTKEGNLYYYDMHKMSKNSPARLLKSDLKNLANKK